MWTVRIVTMFGGLAKITRRRLSALSDACRATWFGLMRQHISSFISTHVHQRSHRTTICARPSGDTSKECAHVPLDWPYPLDSRKRRQRRVPVPSRQGVKMELDPNMITCTRCAQVVYLNTKNAVLYRYLAQPWFTHWIVVCTKCENYHKMFCRNNWQWEWEWAERHKVGIITETFVEEDIEVAFMEAYDLMPLTERELTEQDEKNIKFLHWLLQHYDTSFFDDSQRGEL
jgi:hypothetical protein